MDSTGIKRLSEAILKQASSDYLFYYTSHSKCKYGQNGWLETEKNHNDAIRFFNSHYCEMITGIEGFVIRNRLDRLIKQGNAKAALNEVRRNL